MSWGKIFCLAGFFLFLLKPAGSQQMTDSLAILRVGVKEAPPFVIKDGSGFRGVSIELWQKIATELDLAFEYREMDLEAILEGLETGTVDICVNPLSVTSERIRRIDFTQPYYTSHSAIAVIEGKGGQLWVFLKNLFSFRFLLLIVSLLLLLLLVGLIAWLLERRHNPTHFRQGWRGVLDGVWWVATTMTTVGYGDKVPVSSGGRIMGVILMLTAVITISWFTATITSVLTVNRLGSSIHTINDLRDMRVGVVTASATENYLRHIYLKPEEFPDIASGLEALNSGRIDAFVHDEPILRYITEHMRQTDIQVLPHRFNTEYYSFGLPRGSTLTNLINPLLLFETELLEWKVMLSEYGLNEM